MSKRTLDLPRQPRDLYESWDSNIVHPMAPLWSSYDDPSRAVRYIEPFCGSGELIANMASKCDAQCVYASDIEPLPKTKGVPNDLEFRKHNVFESAADLPSFCDEVNATHFISNPPWVNDKASDFQLLRIINTLAEVRPTWLLLNANFAFNKRSSDAMAICTDIITVGRLKWIKGSRFSATEDSAWFLFDPKTATGSGPVLHPRTR